jgi:hypothetical protein
MQKNSLTNERQFRWRLLLVALALALIMAIVLWPKEPLAQRASRDLLQAVLDSDYDWIFDHALDEEKRIPGFKKDVIKAFHQDFLGELAGGRVMSVNRIGNDQFTRAMVIHDVRLRSGKTVEIGTTAYGEEGEEKVSAIEAMFNLRLHLDSQLGRPKRGWFTYADWFEAHGLQTVYIGQTGELFQVVEESKLARSQ